VDRITLIDPKKKAFDSAKKNKKTIFSDIEIGLEISTIVGTTEMHIY